jgi:hypothetical protein
MAEDGASPREPDPELAGSPPPWLSIPTADPLAPAAEFAQITHFGADLSRQTGQHRPAARLTATVIVLAIMAALVFGLVGAIG